MYLPAGQPQVCAAEHLERGQPARCRHENHLECGNGQEEGIAHVASRETTRNSVKLSTLNAKTDRMSAFRVWSVRSHPARSQAARIQPSNTPPPVTLCSACCRCRALWRSASTYMLGVVCMLKSRKALLMQRVVVRLVHLVASFPCYWLCANDLGWGFRVGSLDMA